MGVWGGEDEDAPAALLVVGILVGFQEEGEEAFECPLVVVVVIPEVTRLLHLHFQQGMG